MGLCCALMGPWAGLEQEEEAKCPEALAGLPRHCSLYPCGAVPLGQP